ncbi:hypothetical protein HPB52_024868 [Rhipicephalus sanguineus]|uniref:Peptidase M13 C-terminal domain-containing protein n=1 Tax=Rhipicephalus sanguineus TaxID=34632 RepID=A0A9D4TDT1_RHISA|nr:hypothetical protein HPB52_024868 [Rhipicephalus sanguineus]
MAYSGLGFQLARALVKIADEHGRRLDYIGRENDWWEMVQNCTWDLAQSEHEKRGVADLFALELALEAFKRSSRSNYQPVKIRGLERLSEAQTFFMSYCSSFCDNPDGARLCGLAANSARHGSAFSLARRISACGRSRGGHAGQEGPSKLPKLSPAVGGRRAGRLASEVTTPVPAARRRRPKTRTETLATTAAPGSLDTTVAQRDTSSPAAPSSGGVASSSGILSVTTMTNAAPSPSSLSSEEDEVESMRWLAADREDQSDLASDGGARGTSALDGPFNSTMVEGGVPIHQVPSPSMTSTGGPSTRTLVPDTEDEPLADVPQPMASHPLHRSPRQLW